MPLTGYTHATSPGSIILGPAILYVGGVPHSASRGTRVEFIEETTQAQIDGLVAPMAGLDYRATVGVRITGQFLELGEDQIARYQSNTTGVLASGVTTFTPRVPGGYLPSPAGYLADMEVRVVAGNGDVHAIAVPLAHVATRSMAGMDGVALTLEARSTDPDVVPYVHTIDYVIAPPDTNLVFDSFTRADHLSSLGSAETGQLWTAHTGTWGIAANQAYVNTTVGGYNLATVDAGVLPGSVSAIVRASDAAGPGVCTRFTNASNMVTADFVSGDVRLIKVDGGAFTVHITAAHTWVSGDVIEIRDTVTHLSLWVNGTQMGGTIADTFNNTATRCGLVNGSHDAPRYDDFTVTA